MSSDFQFKEPPLSSEFQKVVRRMVWIFSGTAQWSFTSFNPRWSQLDLLVTWHTQKRIRIHFPPFLLTYSFMPLSCIIRRVIDFLGISLLPRHFGIESVRKSKRKNGCWPCQVINYDQIWQTLNTWKNVWLWTLWLYSAALLSLFATFKLLLQLQSIYFRIHTTQTIEFSECQQMWVFF